MTAIFLKGIARRRLLTKQWLRTHQWENHLLRLKAWKTHCLLKDMEHEKRLADVRPPDEMLASMIRRLAGLNANKTAGYVSIGPSEFSASGKVGYRACMSAQWDNAVRASEEDR